jgi:general secretion pathway protein L
MEAGLWWVDQMRSLVPGGLSRAGRQPDALIAVIDRLADETTGAAISGNFLLRRNGQERLAGPLDQHPPPAMAAGLPLLLRLPPGTVLTREIVLPLAAARNLQTVIGFEMDRLTPFAADEVFWGTAGATPDHAKGRLSLRLFVVPRAPVAALCGMLAGLRLAPAFIEVPGGRIPLAGARPPASRLRQMGVSALCVVLALACLATPFIRQQIALDAAAQKIAAYQPAAHMALALRQKLDIAASGRAAILQARRSGDALQVLATLTEALPDGTWLSDLALKSGDLTMDGQSDNAARLIGLLSAVPGLRDPNFTAPVTRTADGRADQFSLHADVAE